MNYKSVLRYEPLSVAEFRDYARQKVPSFVFDFIDGGADDEHCLLRNEKDLADLALVPTQLRDTTNIDLSINILGQRWKAPMGVAPIGLCGLVRPDGDEQMARSAAAHGLPYILSTASNSRLEKIREVVPKGILWQQLYVMSDHKIAEQLIRRARIAKYDAIVLTIDVPVSGQRRRDLRNGFHLPLRRSTLFLDAIKHPLWLLRMLQSGSPNFPNLSEDNKPQSAEAMAALVARKMDRGLNWDSLLWLRRLWDGPLLLKGILHPNDAKRALKCGIDGLIVSNHGGRQLDAAPSTVSVLPKIADVVSGRIPLLVDSGFRRGSDIIKAVGLGANAVLLGRAPLYGLCCNGELGVRSVFKLLEEDLVRNMILLGASSVDDISFDHIYAPASNLKSVQRRTVPKTRYEFDNFGKHVKR